MSKISDEKIEELWHSSGAPHTGVIGFARAIEAAVQRPIADLMCQWKSGKISGDELADKLFSLFASTPSSAVLTEQEKQEPVAWAYTINNSHSIFSAEKPPEDAYDEGTLYPLYAAPVVQPDMVRPDQEALQQIIAAVLYDFGGFITTRQKQLVASAADNSADTVEALKEFMEKRGINPCQDVPVLSWECWIAAENGRKPV